MPVTIQPQPLEYQSFEVLVDDTGNTVVLPADPRRAGALIRNVEDSTGQQVALGPPGLTFTGTPASDGFLLDPGAAPGRLGDAVPIQGRGELRGRAPAGQTVTVRVIVFPFINLYWYPF